MLETYKGYFIDDDDDEDPGYEIQGKKRKNVNNNTETSRSRKRLLLPSAMDIAVTKEGVAAVDEAIEFLRGVDASQLKSLTMSEGLSNAARDLGVYSGVRGIVSDVDNEGYGMDKRADRHGEWLDAIGENVHYGEHYVNIGTSIVLDWIIDDGVPNRGHRQNVFSDQFTTVGVYYGPHKKFKHVCVATFAGGYIKAKLIPRSPRVRFADENSNSALTPTKALPFVKEMLYNDDNKVVDTTSAVTVNEIHQKAKVMSSPSPGVTQITRTFFTSSVPRKRTNTVPEDLANLYKSSGIPLVDSSNRKFNVAPSPQKIAVPGKEKIVRTSIIKQGIEKVLDVTREPFYQEDEEKLRVKRRKRDTDEPQEKGWFSKLVNFEFFGSK